MSLRLTAATIAVMHLLASETFAQLDASQFRRIDTLIGEFANVGHRDYGYSPTANGTGFLAVDAEGQFGNGILFQPPAKPAPAMRELVKLGASAIPQLLDHLDDNRRTRVFITNGFGGVFMVTTDDPKPAFFDQGHAITIGDLCCVTLGQIVNRDYSVVRYIPSGNVSISSPTRAPSIANRIRAEMKDMSLAKHRQLLIDDMMQWDDDELRVAAAKRLSFYYPKAFAEQIDALLQKDFIGDSDADEFVEKVLLKTKEIDEAKKRFDAFVKEHGELARYTISVQLFNHVQNGHRKNYDAAGAEKLLGALYGLKNPTDRSERPKNPGYWWPSSFARFMRDGLAFVETPTIERAVRDLMRTTKIDAVAEACVEYLVGRGYDADIEATLRRHGNRNNWAKVAEDFRERKGWTRLHNAIDYRFHDRVARETAAKRSINTAGASGESPLQLAVSRGDRVSVSLLLNAGADTTVRNKQGDTPLDVAVDEMQIEIADDLEKHGAVPRNLLSASYSGRGDLVKQFLREPKALERKTQSDDTALHLACWKGHAAIVKSLCEAGHLVDPRDNEGLAPLHLAIRRGHGDIVDILIKHKANLTPASTSEQSPLMFAIASGQLAIAKRLAREGANIKQTWTDDKFTLVHVAAMAGQRDCLDWLLSLGEPVDVRNERQETALHLACRSGSVDCAKLLLSRHADPNATDVFYDLPLNAAIASGKLDVVKILIAHPRELVWDAEAVMSPVELARSFDQPQMAELLQAVKFKMKPFVPRGDESSSSRAVVATLQTRIPCECATRSPCRAAGRQSAPRFGIIRSILRRQ